MQTFSNEVQVWLNNDNWILASENSVCIHYSYFIFSMVKSIIPSEAERNMHFYINLSNDGNVQASGGAKYFHRRSFLCIAFPLNGFYWILTHTRDIYMFHNILIQMTNETKLIRFSDDGTFI